MSSSSDLVSIIMPCFNAGAYLSEAIDSVINQSHDNWELIIVNDGSTDQSREILDNYVDPRIRIFHLDNRGVSVARNRGLKRARGEYLLFLDADDVLPVDSLKSRLLVFASNPQTSFVDGRVKIFDATLKKILKIWSPSFTGNPFHNLLKLGQTCFWGPSWMIHKSVIGNNTFHAELTHGEDLLFFIDLCKSGEFHYRFVNEEILHHRTGHGSAMQNLDGLLNGYLQLYRLLSKDEHIPKELLREFGRKSKSIRLKICLHHLKITQFLKILFENPLKSIG